MNAASGSGHTPLLSATLSDSAETVTRLAADNRTDVNWRTLAYGESALTMAFEAKRRRSAKALLNCLRVDVNIRTGDAECTVIDEI